MNKTEQPQLRIPQTNNDNEFYIIHDVPVSILTEYWYKAVVRYTPAEISRLGTRSYLPSAGRGGGVSAYFAKNRLIGESSLEELI